MDKTIRKNVSGSTNNSEASDQPAFVSNRWQPDWPDYTIAIAWPQTPPDLLSIPANQLKQLMLQARAYDPMAIEIFTTLAMPIVKYYSSLPNIVSVLEKDEAYGIANHTMMDFLMHERLRKEKQDIPTMLKRAIRCDLMNQIDRIKNRRHFETYHKPTSLFRRLVPKLSSMSPGTPGDRDRQLLLIIVLLILLLITMSLTMSLIIPCRIMLCPTKKQKQQTPSPRNRPATACLLFRKRIHTGLFHWPTYRRCIRICYRPGISFLCGQS